MNRLLRLRNRLREYFGYDQPVVKMVSLVGFVFFVLNADHAVNGPAVLRLVIHYLTVNEGELLGPPSRMRADTRRN
jgi:hypothetical protein